MMAPHDLRDYLFDELTAEQRTEVETYLETSPEAREELDGLRLTRKALLSVPDEEIPRRIAFVSDKVFEPSWAARVWRELWAGAPRVGFGMAAVIVAFFGGLWLAQPTLTVDGAGWQVAFGGPAQAVEAVAEPLPESGSGGEPGLTQEQVQAVVAEVVARYGAESEARLRGDLAVLVSKQGSESDARLQAAVNGLRGEAEQAWWLLKTKIDSITYTTSAEMRPAGLPR